MRFQLFLFCLIMLFQSATAQIRDTIVGQSGSGTPEKIYVHFDKPFYNPGETIWFKAYLLNGILPESASRNFYAELVDREGRIRQRLVAPVMESSANGSFDLPDSSGIGPYIFRAYTLAILKADTTRIFSKQINVVGQSEQGLTEIADPVLRFFPEGGQLVKGLNSRVAFKLEQSGMPAEGSGEILDAQNRSVTTFSTSHNGMGVFSITPSAQQYRANWTDKSGKQHSAILPAVADEGVVIRVDHQPGGIAFRVQSGTAGRALHIQGTMNNRLLYSANLITGKEPVRGLIPDSIAVSGVFRLTVYDEARKPLTERVIFIYRPEDFFQPAITKTQVSVTRRGKNELVISTSGGSRVNLSLAVTAAEAVEQDTLAHNIITSLLLSGEIRGYIHDPWYYFSGSSDALKKLDLVMLTHGWRRYTDAQTDYTPPSSYSLSRDDYLRFEGQISGIPPGNIPEGQLLNIIVQYKDTSMQFLEVPVRSDGSFTISGIAFYDTASFYYTFNRNRALNNRATISITDNLFKGVRRIDPLHSLRKPKISSGVIAQNTQLREQYLSATDKRSRQYKILETVIIQARVKSELQKRDEKYSRGMFRGGDARSFDLVNDPLAASFFNIFQYLQGRVAGLQVANSFGNPVLRWRGGVPALFLDEMRVDAGMLANIPITDVAYIKVFRPPFVGAFNGGSGAIAVYTRRGDERPVYDPRGLAKIDVAGYTPVKEFYSPDYATSSPLHELEDLRTTILWKPYILLDKENRSETIQFYNNDFSKRLRIIIEGVDEQGRLGRQMIILDGQEP